MNIIRTLGSGSLSVTAMLDFSGKGNTAIHGLGEGDTAISVPVRFSIAGERGDSNIDSMVTRELKRIYRLPVKRDIET